MSGSKTQILDYLQSSETESRSSAILNVLTERGEREKEEDGRKEGERDTFLSLLIAALSSSVLLQRASAERRFVFSRILCAPSTL